MRQYQSRNRLYLNSLTRRSLYLSFMNWHDAQLYNHYQVVGSILYEINCEQAPAPTDVIPTRAT